MLCCHLSFDSSHKDPYRHCWETLSLCVLFSMGTVKHWDRLTLKHRTGHTTCVPSGCSWDPGKYSARHHWTQTETRGGCESTEKEIPQAKQGGQDICHTVIPFAKCRPIYKLKDLLASCSANVGQYHGIKQEGGDYHRVTTAVAAKSTVSPPPPPPIHALPRGHTWTAFQPGCCLLLHYLMTRTWGELCGGLTGRKYWHPVLFNLTHIQQPQLDALI